MTVVVLYGSSSSGTILLAPFLRNNAADVSLVPISLTDVD